VHVDATRPLLQKDATGSARFLSSDDITKLPTRGYKDAAAQQTGVVNFGRQIDAETSNGNTLIIRGGRPNETAFYVDGFSQQDPLTGNATTNINNNAIREVVLLNGGFNAEYGRIMSGVINVITREGGDKYSGSLEAVSDNFGGFGKSFAGTKIYDNNVYDAAFGGPIMKGRNLGSFYYSGQRRWDGDRSPNAVYSGPQPNNSLGGWTHQGKLSFPLAKQIDLRLGMLYSQDNWREYLNQYRFDLNHSPRYLDRNQSFTATLNHTLSSKSYYSLGGSYFYTERKRGDGVYFDDVAAYNQNLQSDLVNGIPWFWPGFTGQKGDALSDTLAAHALGTGHVFDDYLHRESSYFGFKGDYTSQLNAYNQGKAGFEFDRHKLRFYDSYFPVSLPGTVADINSYGYSADGQTHVDSGRDGPAKPFTGSVYAQDKYERSGVVVNAGLRYDYINTDAKSLVNENTPLGGNSTLDASDLTESKTYSRLSPRLGLGFPVTDQTVLHVNWGQFYQQPNLQDLYVSYQFLEHKIRTGGYYVGFGNPNLKPEQTTAYEVGIAHKLSDFARLDITAYYKDVRDLVEVTTISSIPNNFASYRNKDFATIKGLDLGFTLRRVNHVEATMNYSLSYAVGTGSVSNTQRNIAWTASEPPKQTAPLDFDQRHKVSVNLDYSLGAGEGWKWNGKTPLANVSIDALYNVASGTPFTPTTVYDEVTLAAVQSNPTGPINSIYGPWTQTLDFKITKNFAPHGNNISAYLWVTNAFNTKNALAVFTGTGTASGTDYLNTDDGRTVAANLASMGIDPNRAYQLALESQTLYGPPRMVRLGMRLGF
jgi:outer membrane receptor protein involved in Fe transport